MNADAVLPVAVPQSQIFYSVCVCDLKVPFHFVRSRGEAKSRRSGPPPSPPSDTHCGYPYRVYSSARKCECKIIFIKILGPPHTPIYPHKSSAHSSTFVYLVYNDQSVPGTLSLPKWGGERRRKTFTYL